MTENEDLLFLTCLVCLVLVGVQTVTKNPVPFGSSFIFSQLGAVFHYNIKFQVASSLGLYLGTVMTRTDQPRNLCSPAFWFCSENGTKT